MGRMRGGETPLSGGNASPFVRRVGDTVRKPWTASTPSVHRLLSHLRAEVGDLVPLPMGRDGEGRQVLEFVAGTEAMYQMPLSVDECHRVGELIRRLHDASTTFARRDDDAWTTAMRTAGDEIIGHNDLAPWNLIRGSERWAFIDWDGAGPTTPIADLGYAARSFAQLVPEHDLGESRPLLRSLVEGYGAAREQRKGLVVAMVERAEAMRDLLLRSAVTGAEPWATMARTGHAAAWTAAAAHARANFDELLRGLA
jgi:Ser/Thr protein kinase RdoA (MazF antagonist)